VKTVDTNSLKIIGKIASAKVVKKKDDLTIISANGVILRTNIGAIKQAGRATRGVKVVNLDKGDSVASIAIISAEENIPE
jgi:DNA gyrase subunit A